MKKSQTIAIAFILVVFSTSTWAQSGKLISPCIGTFSRNSLLFDLQATNNIVLDSIAILSQNCGTRDFKVYYKTGSYLGFNSNPGAWTLLDSTVNFTPTCALSCPIPPTVIPVKINLCMAAGQTYGIYIAMTGGSGTIESHNVLASGTVAAQDPNLSLITGEGHNGTVPFNTGGTLAVGLTIQGEFHYHTPFVSLGSDTTLCNGDSILLNAGSSFSTFQWNNGTTNQSIYASNAGIYSVLVDSGACQATDSISVSFQSCTGINANLMSSDTIFCEKQCLDFFDLSTNNPTSWLWLFPGSDSTTSTLQNPTGICYSSYGSFDVTLIACNATGCDTLFLPGFINEFQSPPVPNVTSNYDTLFSTAAFSYQWYNSSGAIAGATSQYYVYQLQGSHYVIIADSNGCTSSSNVIYTTIEQSDDESGLISVYPNPASQNFTILFINNRQEKTYIQMTDNLGRLVFSKYYEEQQNLLQINTANITEGVYILMVRNGDKVIHKRIIISH